MQIHEFQFMPIASHPGQNRENAGSLFTPSHRVFIHIAKTFMAQLFQSQLP